MMKIGSIYSASDKALFDALSQGAVTVGDLRQLFLTHGMIISRSTSRQELATHFSRLVHDYDDFQALAKLFDTGKRRERLSSFHVESSASLDNFEDAAHKVVEQLKANADIANLKVGEDGALEISVRYKTFHFNKSEFRQVEIRDAVVTIEQEDGKIVIRGPQNEKVDEICRALVSIVETDINDEIRISEISLEYFTEPAQRTRFFIDLIELVEGYKKYDVTDVFVFKPKIDEEEADDDVQGAAGDGEDVDLGIHISRATLKGVGVLESPEMKNLIGRGFYISKIIWQAKSLGSSEDKYEFEAQFSEPETCTRFSYLVRGHYKYQAEEMMYSKTRVQLTSEEDVELSKAIEKAASASLNKLRVEA